MLDSGSIVAIVVAGISLITSVLTAIIGNHFNYKRLRIELDYQTRSAYEANKRAAVVQYIDCVSRVIDGIAIYNTYDYLHAYAYLMLFLPADLQNDAKNIDNAIRNKDQSLSATLFLDFSKKLPELYKELPRSERPYKRTKH